MRSLIVPTTKTVAYFASEKPSLSILDLSSTRKRISLEERVTLLLMRDLVRLGWRLNSSSSKSFEFSPPQSYDKDIVRQTMAYSRNQTIENSSTWIEKHLDLARANLGYGHEILKSYIIPRIEICKTKEQHNIFRIFRYFWSSPASDYVGRRMRFLIRDDDVKDSPVIGIAAIGSSIIHISDRDKWIGWDTETRTKRIIYMMDAYVIGAMPPYNYLLGGKLVSYILASNEIRTMYKKKYAKMKTIIKKRKASDLVLIATTGLYGRNSSQYNRMKFGKSMLYKPIGTTLGFGTLHISNETFLAMKELADTNGCNISNRFGKGPNWRMRVIRSACDALGLNSEVILKHSFQRGLFAIPLAINYKSFLRGDSKKPIYRNLPLKKLVEYWRNRWLHMRKQNDLILEKVRRFSPKAFIIEKTNIE